MNLRYISVPHQQHQISTLYKGLDMTERHFLLKWFNCFLQFPFHLLISVLFIFTSFAFTLQKKICLIHYWQLFETRHLKLFRYWSSKIEISLVNVYFFKVWNSSIVHCSSKSRFYFYLNSIHVTQLKIFLKPITSNRRNRFESSNLKANFVNGHNFYSAENKMSFA